MGFIIAFYLLISAFFMIKKEKTLSSPNIIFYLLWGVIAFLASLRLFDLYGVTLKTWLIILIGCIFFSCGIRLSNRIKSVKSENLNNDSKTFISRKTFWILFFLLCIYLFPNLIQTLYFMIKGYSLDEIRLASYGMAEVEGYVRISGILEYIDLIFSIIELYVVAIGINFFVKNIKNKDIMLAVFAYVITKSLTFGGRFGIAYIIIEIIVCYFLYFSAKDDKKADLHKKMNKYITRIIFISSVAIVFLTLARGSQISELFKKFYRYICGNIVFLDIKISEIDSMKFLSFSFAGFYGFWSTVLPFFSKIGIIYPSIYLDTINNVMNTQLYREIGYSMSTNAFATPFYHLYADFRILGVIIGMTGFGLIAGYIYRKAKNLNDETSIIFYLIISQMLFKTIYGYPFASKIYFWAVILMFIIYLYQKKSKRVCDENQIRVAEINMVDYGSTGKIMFQIADCARLRGIDIKTFSKKWRRQSSPNKYHSYYGSTFENSIHVFLSRLIGFQGCFSYFGTKSLVRKLKIFKPDIIHLHNLHDSSTCLSVLFKYIKKNNIKTIWTLHDCWPMTGGCYHFTMSKCEKWKTCCNKCEYLDNKFNFDCSKYMWLKKNKLFTGLKNFIVVTPSKWLSKIVKESYLGYCKIKVINNGTDLSVFKPTKTLFKSNHNIDGYMVLTVAHGWGIKKGLDVVIDLSNSLPSNYKIVIVGTNSDVEKILPSNVIAIRRTSNQKELAEIYSSADVFINPTREDNFPTVNIESLGCGTPVVTFKTGGSPESIDKKSGIVVPCNDVEAMKKAIIDVCENKKIDRKNCIARSKKFDKNDKFNEYVDLYENMCSKKNVK